MSTEQIWETDSTSLAATLQIAERVGNKLRGGEVIVLSSDLGGGKTAFVRGLAKGMGSSDAVRSPSFTLRNQYRSGKLTLYHFDFYRLDDPGILRDELAELLGDTHAIIVIEWADIVRDTLPPNSIVVSITATGENTRHFRAVYADAQDYLFEQAAA